MYCQFCEEEQSPRSRFCKACGAKLLERSPDKIQGDLSRHKYLLEQVLKWTESGKVERTLAEDLLAPHRRKIEVLEVALAVARGAPIPEPVKALVALETKLEPTAAAPPIPEALPAATPQAPAPVAVDVATIAAPPAVAEPRPVEEPRPAAPAEPLPAPAATIAASPAEEPRAALPPPREPKSDAAAVAAASAAALGSASVVEPLDFPEAPPTAEQQIIERESTWAKLWKPFLSETVLWFTGPFLLLAGALFFAKESEGVVQALIVTGILALYAGIFWFVGRRLVKKPNLLVAGRILTGVSVGLAPLSLLALGWGSMKAAAPGLFLGSTVAVLAGMSALAWACAGTYSERGRTQFAAFASFLLFLFAAVPFVDHATWLAALDAGALLALWLYAPAVGEVRDDKGHAGMLGGAIAWFALVLFVRVHYQGLDYGFGWVQYGPLFAMLVAVVLRAEKKLLDFQGGPSWLALLAYGSLVVPAVCVFKYEARPFGPSFGVTCLIISVLLVLGAVRWRSRAFTGISVVVGWLSFHALTGLFKLEWLFFLRDSVKAIGGYGAQQTLPHNYHGLASLIYLALLAWAYSVAKKAGATWATGVLRWFSLGGAVALLVWGHAGEDFKPALFTSAIVFAGAFALSHWLTHWKLSYLAAVALVLTGLDVGLVVDHHSVHPAVIGLAGAALAAVAISVFVSAERARCFRDLGMVGFLGAALLVPFVGTGWLACLAWGLTGLAGVALAFAMGSGVPAAIGLMALAGTGLQVSQTLGAHDSTLAWIGFGLAFALLAGSGFEKQPATTSPDRGRWFGSRLPLAAEGYAVLRGPMAFAGFAAAVTALVLSIGASHHDGPALAFAAFALTQLWLARRQPTSAFLAVALLAGCTSAVLAAATWFHDSATIGFAVLAACGLVCSGLAVAVERVEPFRRFLRIDRRWAGWTFVVHACLFAGSAALLSLATDLDADRVHSSPALALAAATFLALPRFNRWAGWLYPFQAFACAAVAMLVPTSWVALVVAGFAYVPLALGLLARRDSKLSGLVCGVDPEQQSAPFVPLARLHGLAGVAACFVVGAGELAPLPTLSPAAGAVFFALLPMLDGEPIWLALFGIGAWATVAVTLQFDLIALSLAAFSAILVALGAMVERRFSSSAKVLAATGLGLAACALAAWGYGWPVASAARAETLFALVALALVLAPRTFQTALFLPAAFACGAVALALAAPAADRTLWLSLAAAGLGLLSVALRRFPALASALFGLPDPHGALWALTVSGSVLALASAALSIAWGGQHLPLAGALGLATATTFLSLLGLEEPWFAAIASVLGVASLAAVDVRPEAAFLLAQSGVNLVFLCAGALALGPTRAVLDRLYDLLSPPGAARGVPRTTEALLVGTASSLAFLGLVVLMMLSLWRIFAFGPLGVFAAEWAPWMAGAQVVTALHQLRRRPALASWHGLLTAVLAALWLLFSMPLWNYVAGAWALGLVLLAWATRSPAGRAAVDVLSPGLTDSQLDALRKTLSGYSTAAALLGLQAIHPENLESPVSWALLTATFGLQAVLGSGAGKVLLLIALPFTVHYAAFHVGIRLNTGRPQEVILPYLAAAMASVALLAERVGVWRSKRGHGGSGVVAAHLYGLLAAFEWIAGLLIVRYGSAEIGACFVAGAALTLMWTLRALAENSRLFAWGAELSFLAVYLSLRLQTDWLGPRGARGDQDSLATLVLGALFLGLHTAVKKLDVPSFRQPTRFAALAMPVLSALLMAREATYGNSVLLLGVALQLTLLSWVEGRGKLSGIFAAIAYNLAISVLWLKQGIGGGADAQFYVIPAGLTLIGMAHVWGASLGPAWKARLRSLGVLAIYMASALPALGFEKPAYLWWAIGLCLVGIVVGIALHVRSYLYLGMGFMVGSLVVNMTRYGLRDHRVGAAFMTGLGLVIIVGMVFFSSRRAELLDRYRKYRALVAGWE